MPLTKKALTNDSIIVAPAVESLKVESSVTTEAPKPPRHTRETSMTKDDYWRRREERDGQRDKDMAWSGLAQAALGSVLVAQLNTDNTEDGLVKLVARITEKLLKERDAR
jgi:hypothetical protein